MFDRNIYAQPLRSEMPDESSAWFAVDVKSWKPGTDFIMSADVDGYPCSLADLPAGVYTAQAVFHVNMIDPSFSSAPGNIYSPAVAAVIRDSVTDIVGLSLNHMIDQREVLETGFIKEISLTSRLLTSYLGRPTSVKGMVVLPPSYYLTPEQEYATVFVLPGFGAKHTEMLESDFQRRRYGMNSVGREKIFVFMDQNCPLGCHCFANSENNGPWSTALIEEFIPYLEKSCRVYHDPSTRFLIGQSSGAWAGLWLQINYPDQFGGVWACSPDPVDFKKFLNVDIYQPQANLFYTDSGSVIELNKFLSDLNRVIGDGWALSTFEAVFGPRGKDGHPMKLWNSDTGVIDPDVAEVWKKYDLRLILQESSNTLAPKLAGKLHIYVSEDDPFSLDAPVKSLQEAMAGSAYDMEIEILSNGGHNLWTGERLKHIHEGIDERIAEQHPLPVN